MIHTLLIFIGIYIASFVLAYLISEKWTHPFGLFDVYPFKCRKCCTTWMMIGGYTMAFMGGLLPLSYIYAAVMLTAMNVAAFIYDERERGQIEYEEDKEERKRRYEDSQNNIG